MASHIASPHNTHVKAPAIPQEDIASVLERFQKWAGHSTEPVRELTYEEAIARTRRRAPDEKDGERASSTHAAASPIHAPSPIPFPRAADPSASTTPSEEPNKEDPFPDTAGLAAAAKDSDGKADRQKTKTVTTKATTKRALGASATPSLKNTQQDFTPPAPMDISASAPAAAASAYEVIRHAASQHRTEAHATSAQDDVTFEQMLARHVHEAADQPDAESEKLQTVPPGSKAQPVASAAPEAPAIPVAPLPENVRAVHLTVRLAPQERETMRRHAHERGITPSDYMRQCALEVDILRAQLANAKSAQAEASAALVKAMEEQRPGTTGAALCLSIRTPRRKAVESEWFRRLKNFVFPRKAKNQAHTQSNRQIA